MGENMTPLAGQPERRRVQRIALRLNATARERGRNRVSVRVIDISTHGCRIEILGGSFVEGSIWLSMAGIEAHPSRVVWNVDGFAGLEFIAPLDEAVLDRLLAASKNPTESVVSELRDLAARTHRLSGQSINNPETSALRDFSRDCSVQAIVHGLQLGGSSSGGNSNSQLTSSMIRRGASDPRSGTAYLANLANGAP
jgi:hypothetical protein